ncbi:MAG: hypothetical protein LBK60_02955 [Verrucomicrobiales bacterium]|jgi:hypothetical protein|nr:hypothetical protein [Verrucomicrobiales bacterium]
MKTNNNINWRAMLKVSGIVMMAALTMNVSAETDTYTFPSAESGTAYWDTSAGGWYLNDSETPTDILPPASGTDPIVNVDVVIGNGTDPLVFEYGFGTPTGIAGHVPRNSLTISDNVTLKLLGNTGTYYYSNSRIVYNTVTNNSLMEVLGSRTFSIDTAGRPTVLFTNSGTISNQTSGATLLMNAAITNTDGLIDIGAGATLSIGSSGSTGIYGGVLKLAGGARFDTGGGITDNLYLSDVAIDHAGVMVVTNGGTSTGSRNLLFITTNGVFNNTGTVSVWQGATHDFSTASQKHTAIFTQSGTNVFTNTGVVSVLNESVINSNAYNEAGVAFTVSNSAAAGGKFTNEGLIDLRNNAHGTYSNTTYAQFTVNANADFTNSGTINIALGDDVTDDALHTAALFINTDWTNTGVITIDRAGKEHATASFELNSKTYTQTGANSETRLLNGGQLKAGAITIDEGLLGGAGRIDAATSINTGATLDPDGTLTLTSLIMNEGSILNFSVTDNDFLQINGDLSFLGAKLTLTDYTGGDPLLLASYTGDLLGQNLDVTSITDAVLNFDTTGKIYLSIIPEPSPAFLLLLGALILILMRKSHRKNTER